MPRLSSLDRRKRIRQEIGGLDVARCFVIARLNLDGHRGNRRRLLVDFHRDQLVAGDDRLLDGTFKNIFQDLQPLTTHRRCRRTFDDEKLLNLAQVVAPSLDEERLDDVAREAAQTADALRADHHVGDLIQVAFGVAHADALHQDHVNVLAERDQLPLDTRAELAAVVVGDQVDDERQRLHDQILDGLAHVVVGMGEARQARQVHVELGQNVADGDGHRLLVDVTIVEVVLTKERPQVAALLVVEARREVVQVADRKLDSEQAEAMVQLLVGDVVDTVGDSTTARCSRAAHEARRSGPSSGRLSH